MNVDQEIGLKDDEVINKYQVAAQIANEVMAQVIDAAVSGALIVELCSLGDKNISTMVLNVYPDIKDKGIAFPTCVSVNHIVGHFSPYSDCKEVLKKNDIVKMYAYLSILKVSINIQVDISDLGVQIDGYISQCAHTIVVEHDTEQPLTGPIADAICAAYFAAEVCHRLIRPGNTNAHVSSMLEKVVKLFNCSLVEGVITHLVKRYILDGSKIVLNRSRPDEQAKDATFEEYETYVVDIVVSTGEGKVQQGDHKTTVYKRALENTQSMKLNSSRKLLSDITRKCQSMAFTLRSFDPKIAKLGIVELVKSNLVYSYPVLEEKKNQHVVQFKFTLLLLPNGQFRLNKFDEPFVSSSYDVGSNPEIAEVLAMSTEKDE